MSLGALVTGVGGFIGRHAADELRRRGWRVFELRRRAAAGRPGFDLSEPAAARRAIAAAKPSLIIHAAGATVADDWQEYWEANVGMTLNLLEAVAARPGSRPARVVIAGSSAEYGAAWGKNPAREDGPADPLGVYGASKLSQTQAALSFAGPDLEVLVARIFNVTGPGCPDRQVPGAFTRQIAEIERGARDPRLDVGNLSPRRDFVDIRDIARALSDLGESRAPSGIYNVCSGRAVAIDDVLKTLVALARRPIAVRADPSRRRKTDLDSIVGDGQKLERATGWKPAVPLARSLRDTLNWHRARAAEDRP